MCKSEASATMGAVLDLPKSTYYYCADVSGKRAQKAKDKEIAKEIAHIFKESRNNYGTRKIKGKLAEMLKSIRVSYRRIGRLMKDQELVSNYTIAQFKSHKSMCNEASCKK